MLLLPSAPALSFLTQEADCSAPPPFQAVPVTYLASVLYFPLFISSENSVVHPDSNPFLDAQAELFRGVGVAS